MMVYGGIGAQDSGTRTEKDLNKRAQYILNERDNKHSNSLPRILVSKTKTSTKTSGL